MMLDQNVTAVALVGVLESVLTKRQARERERVSHDVGDDLQVADRHTLRELKPQRVVIDPLIRLLLRLDQGVKVHSARRGPAL